MTFPTEQPSAAATSVSVVLLRYWLGMTETEVAAALGCSVGNVKSQASRALAKLRTSADLADGVSHEHQ